MDKFYYSFEFNNVITSKVCRKKVNLYFVISSQIV